MKSFITVIGKDRVGIIASVATLLAEININIEDISQTVLQGMFTMIMAVNLDKCELNFVDIAKKLDEKGKQMDLEISVRHMDIFEAMHRI